MAKAAPASDRDVDSSDNLLISTELLQIQNAKLEAELLELELKAAKVPAIINSDDVSGKWQDEIKSLDTLGKTIESTRETVKDPFLVAGRLVDGYFKSLHEATGKGTPGRLQKARYLISTKVQDYLVRKEAAERKRLEDEAAALRAEEAKQLAIAEKAAEAQRKAEEANRPKAASNQEFKVAEAEANASNAAAHAFEVEQMAKAKPADLARTRSAAGSLGTLNLSWDFVITDINQLKGAPLWQHISRAAKEQAIRAYIKANAPKELAAGADWQPLTGCRMVQKRGLQVR